MIMYWLLGGLSPKQGAVRDAGQLQYQTQSQRGTKIVGYINRIND